MNGSMYDALIIGGGAAGLMAACRLSEAGVHTCIVEKQPRVGRKLLSTGNGRCNLTNDNACPERYHGDPTFAGEVLMRQTPANVRRYFLALGVPTLADEEGRVYPMSNLAASVLDALRLCADENGCETLTERTVTALHRTDRSFLIDTSGGALRARRVLVCTGGPASPKLGGGSDGIRILESLGHSATACAPALTALKTDPDSVRGLKGQRAQGRFTLLIDGSPSGTETGEILFAEAGISGIAAMQLSRSAGMGVAKRRRVELRAELMDRTEAHSLLAQRRAGAPKRLLEDLLSGVCGKRVGMALIRAAGLGPMSRTVGELTDRELHSLSGLLSDLRFPITGVRGLDDAQVTAGGIRPREFDSRTMESRRVPGLYAAGEVLDVDGDCGGFNLQWAWASALTAAEDIINRTRP